MSDERRLSERYWSTHDRDFEPVTDAGWNDVVARIGLDLSPEPVAIAQQRLRERNLTAEGRRLARWARGWALAALSLVIGVPSAALAEDLVAVARKP